MQRLTSLTSFFKMEAGDRPLNMKYNSFVRKIMNQSTDAFSATLQTIFHTSPLQRAFADIQNPAIECLTETLKCVISLKSTVIPSEFIRAENYEELLWIQEYTTWAKDDKHLEAKYKIKALLRKYQKYDDPATRAKDFGGDLKFYMKTPFEFKTFESFFHFCQMCWDAKYVRGIYQLYNARQFDYTKEKLQERLDLAKAFENLAYINFEKALLQI